MCGVQRAQFLPLRAVVHCRRRVSGPRAEVADDRHTPHTLAVRLTLFLSLTAAADVVVVVVTDVVSCLLLSINAGRRLLLCCCCCCWWFCGDGCFLIFRTSPGLVPQESRCRKCVLSCFVITFPPFGSSILFSLTLLFFRFVLKQKIEKNKLGDHNCITNIFFFLRLCLDNTKINVAIYWFR